MTTERGVNPDLDKKETEKKPAKPAADFLDLAEAEEYLEWKQTVPPAVRKIVEGRLKGRETTEVEIGLPLSSAFLEKLSKAVKTGQLPDLSQADERVANLFFPLVAVETVSGNKINVFEALSNRETSWRLRLQLYKTQLKPALDWLVEQDLARIKEEMASSPPEPTMPPEKKPQQKGQEETSKSNESDLPPQDDKAHSSMEAGGEKKEGPSRAQFTAVPYWGGYYRQRAYESFDPTKSTSPVAGRSKGEEPAVEAMDILSTRILSGKLRGRQPLVLPMPYDWAPDVASLDIDALPETVKIEQGADGSWLLLAEADGIFNYQIKIAPRLRRATEKPFAPMAMEGDIAEELSAELKKIKAQNLPAMKLAREIVKMVRGHLTYSNSRVAWDRYIARPGQFFKAVWKEKEADCFVANLLACRALREAGLVCRFVGGYYVKGADEAGNAIMHSGNGHAWLEVWDALSARSVRLDATPKGDPNLDSEAQEKELEGKSDEGDYGESDEVMPEKEVREKIKEMKKKQAGGGAKKRAEKTAADLVREQFAREAECTPEQAGEFLRALERVRQIKDESGQPISDRLKDEWRKIIISRRIEAMDYRGPVRLDEGDRLEEPVSALIDIRSKEYNPTGFEKDERVEKEEFDFGGLDLYFSFDLSGSMAEADPASGRAKADVQRDVALLFLDSIMQCAYISRQAGGGTPEGVLPIKIMATLASSRGQIVLPLTERWGPKEQWAVYSALIRCASGGTPTHETLQLISRAAVKEKEELKKKRVPTEKLPVSYVAEITDGGPDNFDAAEAEHVKLKKDGMAVRSYCIGGASASADAASPLQSFSELPAILAADIVGQFKKLNPRRVKT